MTNSPPFDWQLTNLRNYINLTNLSVDSLKLGNYTLQPIGQGTGLLGIPGDYTPPHRFVRTTALTYAAVPPATAADGANLAFHILNSVDIPLGRSQAVHLPPKPRPAVLLREWAGSIMTSHSGSQSAI